MSLNSCDKNHVACRGWTAHLRAHISFCHSTHPTLAGDDPSQGGASLLAVDVAAIPSAFGAVVHRQCLQSQEYLLDPAVIDNCTQVEAMCLFPQGKHLKNESELAALK